MMDTGSSARFERLLWLMPAAYASHIPEEYFGGFQHYAVAEMGGPYMPTGLFFLNNSIFMIILLALCFWASRARSTLAAFALMSWATGNLFWNFVVHLFFTTATGVFSPGLVTGTLFYYPIPFLVTLAAIRQGRLSVASSAGAFAVGGLLMFLVLWGGLYHFALWPG